MKGQINLIYVGILTLISLAIFGTLVIWNFSITETSTNKASEVQMEIIANQVLEDINYLSSFESNSVYRVKKSFPNTINEDDYCIRLFQDESGDKRIYITKSGNSLSYSSFKKTDIYVDVTNKNIDFENTISCGGNVNIVRNQTIVSISNDEFSVAVPIVDAPPSISSIVDQSTNEDTQKVIEFSVSDESLTTLSLTSISGNTELVNQTENGGMTIPSSSTASRTITLVPNSNKFGVVEINITATDDLSQTYTESFNLTISSVNDDPEWEQVIPDQSVSEDSDLYVVDSDLRVTGNGRCVDVDVQDLTFSVSDNAAQVDCEIDGEAQLQFTPATNWFGTASCTVTCSDGTANSDDTFQIIVGAVNDAPVWNPVIPDQSFPEDSSINVDLYPYHTDVDGCDSCSLYSISNINPSTEDLNCVINDNQYLFCYYEGASLSDSVYFDVTIDAADGLGGTAQDTTQITVTPAAGCDLIVDPGQCNPPEPGYMGDAHHNSNFCFRNAFECSIGDPGMAYGTCVNNCIL